MVTNSPSVVVLQVLLSCAKKDICRKLLWLTWLALGFSEIPEDLGMESLAEAFPVEGMGRAAVRFDEEQLARTNTNLLHKLSFADARGYLSQYLSEDVLADAGIENFWNIVRENINHMQEVKHMHDICFGEIAAAEMAAEDVEYISAAAECLPSGEYDKGTWSKWIGEVKAKTGRKGKGLFMPLRLALTGESHGPELADLLPLMGENIAKARLSAIVGAQAAA